MAKAPAKISLMAQGYNPKDNYWFVGGDQTKVFSSKTGDYAPINNSAYQAWLAGNSTQTIGSVAELGAVLAQNLLRPNNAEALDAYKDALAETMSVEVLAKALYFVINDVRPLMGQPTITPNQYKNWLKGIA